VFGSAILEVAIGLAFVFLLVSIICSAIREGLEAFLKTRAAYLERGIRELLHDREGRGLARKLYHHPLIFGLYSGAYTPGKDSERVPLMARGERLPSYIPAATFANALMDIAARGPDPAIASDPSSPPLSLESIRANILNIENEPVQRVLLTAVDSAQGDLDRARAFIQSWYDSGMDRISGWYKRSTQWIIFAIGLLVAFTLNVNTLVIADYLYRNDAARTALVARAEAAAVDSAPLGDYAAARQALDSLRLPIGWPAGWATVGWGGSQAGAAPAAGTQGSFAWNRILVPLVGWLLTALAATLGAPFWFDILNKVMVIRSTVKPREKSPEEGSEDRRPRNANRSGPPGSGNAGSAPAGGPSPPPTADVSGAAETPHTGNAPRASLPLADGCDVPITRATPDEDLPAAEGGVG
jgi:hypothetical protein